MTLSWFPERGVTVGRPPLRSKHGEICGRRRRRPLVEEHLARYAVSCPLCKAVDQLGVGQQECEIASSNGTKDSISVIVVVCTRCGYPMPLAADRIAPADEKAA